MDQVNRTLVHHRGRHVVLVLAALVALGVACDGGTNPSPSATPAARDFCTEQGFVDGEQRNEAGELIAECELVSTPEGGAYSIARYSNANGPADKDDATDVEITEYDADGNVVTTTYGTIDDE